MRTAGIAVVFLVAAALAPGGEVSFNAKPTAAKDGDKVKISFAVGAPTDVEIAVLDAKGAVVRHLAAGLLGKNAPEPLKKDALAQELLWDGRDDAGKPAAGAPFKVRVSIGAKPVLEKYAGWNGNTLSGAVGGLAPGKGGELYVLTMDGSGRSEVRVLDKDGKYLRTIMPYPANTPKERTASVGHLEVEGQRLPIVFSGHGQNLSPLTSGMRQQSMAFSPKGHLVLASAVGTWADHRPPRFLLALHPEGGAPDGVNFVGPQIRPTAPIGFMGGAGEAYSSDFDHLAVSPDGEWTYFIPYRPGDKGARHSVFRLKWTDKELGTPFLGKDKAPGGDDEHFNDPQGLATDKAGNIYVCDYGNNRVVTFDEKGKYQGETKVPNPGSVCVHPVSGVLYVGSSAQPLTGKHEPAKPYAIIKLNKAVGGKEVARYEFGNYRYPPVIALDASAEPPKLWMSYSPAYGQGVLVPVTDKGAQFETGPGVGNGNGLSYPMFIAADGARSRVLIRERDGGILTLDLTSGKKSPFAKGEDVALDRDGNAYVLGGKMSRYGPDGKPSPFPGTGSNQMEIVGGYASYGPTVGPRGHCVAPNGDIYFMRSNKWPGGIVNRVDVYGPDGKLKQANLIDGLQEGDCGIGVDAAGNVYVGINIKPKDHPLPAYFEGKVPANPWAYWRKDKGEHPDPPWLYPYQNPYLNHLGSVFKFGPEGGAIYGLANAIPTKKGEPPPPAPALASTGNAPADSAAYWSANLKRECRVKGALWRYAGMGIVPGDFGWGDPGCICWNSHLAADEYGRVFAPNPFRFSVEMLDTNGNQLARIGRYGNADSAGAGSKVPEPEIAFGFPMNVSVSGGKLYVSDAVNRRVTAVKFDHAAEETCEIR